MDSSILEVVNVHRVIWIIVMYKYKLHQQINEQYHGKRVVIIYFLFTTINLLNIAIDHYHNIFDRHSDLLCFVP